MIVYGTIAKQVETCAYGDKHDVAIVSVKSLSDTGNKWLCDNGYEKTSESVYRDQQGREYRRYVSVDYYSNVSYIRDDGIHFRTSPPLLARDILGNPVTERTPRNVW